jgi:hypothetical protein
MDAGYRALPLPGLRVLDARFRCLESGFVFPVAAAPAAGGCFCACGPATLRAESIA